MKNLEIQYVETGKLIPYINNPRINENAVDVVAGSIKEFGFKNPIIVDKDNVIIAGHTRLKAARKLGLEEVPIVKVEDLTEAQIKAFRIADNKTSEFAEWDMGLLEIELEGLDDIFTGFDKKDLDDMFSDDAEAAEGDFDEEPPEEPISKRGDIWLLGKHRLMCGDSTKKEDVAKLMNGDKADLFITDPPYNVDYTGGTKDALKIKNDKQDDASFRQFLVDAFSAADAVMREGAAFYIWHADSEGYNFRGACSDIGWKVRQCLIWVKNSFVMGRQDYQWKHEPCLYGWKEGAAHYFIDDFTNTTVIEDNPNINTMNKEELKEYVKELRKVIDAGGTIIREDRPSVSDLHPTMKPLKLIGFSIKNSSRKGETVLDTFGGSGSTLLTCEQLDRKCYMMELDEKYADVIVNRYINFKESDEDVFLIRDGAQIPYKEVERFEELTREEAVLIEK